MHRNRPVAADSRHVFFNERAAPGPRTGFDANGKVGKDQDVRLERSSLMQL